MNHLEQYLAHSKDLTHFINYYYYYLPVYLEANNRRL